MGACVYENVTKLKLLAVGKTAETAIDNVDDANNFIKDDDGHEGK